MIDKNYSVPTITDDSMEKLIADNMGLVVNIVKSLRPPNRTEYEEYVQLGIIGLWKAIQKHDHSKAKLSTMAWYYIRWEIIRYINKSKKYHTLVNNTDAHYRCELVAKERSLSFKPNELQESLPSTLSPSELVVVNMRSQGYTFQEIGNELGGFTRGWANKLFKSALEKIKDVK